jgi:anti-anti-sigma regulatory factor
MEALKVVTVPEQATVQSANSVAESIMTAFQEAEKVLLNLSRVARIDVSVVHVIYAAKRMAVRDGKQFHLSGTVKPEVCRSLVIGGFCASVSEDARELERQLVDFTSEGAGDE